MLVSFQCPATDIRRVHVNILLLVGVVDRLGPDQMLGTFDHQLDADDEQQHGARVTGERVHLAGTEAERIGAGARARIPVRNERQPERSPRLQPVRQDQQTLS